MQEESLIILTMVEFDLLRHWGCEGKQNYALAAFAFHFHALFPHLGY